MIKENTVLVLGAGSAVPYGFPIGEDLRNSIIQTQGNVLNRLQQLDARFKNNQFIGDFGSFQRRFLNSNVSIDEYLSINRSNEKIQYFGKCAIISCLLNNEKKSLSNTLSISSVYNNKENWYKYLYQALISDLIFENGYQQINRNKLTIITFNYDRSLEFFLINSLINTYPNIDLKTTKAKDLIGIPICHTYGSLGGLKLQSANPHFGYANFDGELEEDFKRILTIHDERGKNDFCADAIRSAKKVFFLGFGFAKENIEYLGGYEVFQEVNEVFVTYYEENTDYITRHKNEFSRKVNETLSRSREKQVMPRGDNQSCLELLRTYL